jgi:alkylhydroperoxidase family enzyme
VWIATVAPEDAQGLLRELYEAQARTLGRPTEITMAGSLYPDLVEVRMRLYQVVESCPSSLTPKERQGVALAVTAVLGSDYVLAGVRSKFLAAGGSAEEAVEFAEGRLAGLGPAAAALARYAAKVAAAPQEITAADVETCRSSGASDHEILDANNLAAYYAYLARVCLGLGIDS